MQRTAINQSTSYHNVPLTCGQLQAASIAKWFKIINISSKLTNRTTGDRFISKNVRPKYYYFGRI